MRFAPYTVFASGTADKFKNNTAASKFSVNPAGGAIRRFPAIDCQLKGSI
jgi:hypothetical protein